MTLKNSTQNNSIILDCISQSIGIEALAAHFLGEDPFVSGISHLASCTIKEGGKSLINEYIFKQNEHPYYFKVSAMIFACAGGAVKYSLTGYYLAPIPGVLPALVLAGCMNGASYELVSDLNKFYPTAIPIEISDVIIKTELSRHFDATHPDSLKNFMYIKGIQAGSLVFFTSITSYPIVKSILESEINKTRTKEFLLMGNFSSYPLESEINKTRTEEFSLMGNFSSCVHHPISYGTTKVENISLCIDVKEFRICGANTNDTLDCFTAN